MTLYRFVSKLNQMYSTMNCSLVCRLSIESYEPINVKLLVIKLSEDDIPGPYIVKRESLAGRMFGEFILFKHLMEKSLANE